MLLDSKLHIYTDHLVVATTNTTPNHALCWLNYIEQLHRYIHSIPDKNNVISDTLSWVDHINESVLSKGEQVVVLRDSVSKIMNFADFSLLIKCFLHLLPLPVQDTKPATTKAY